MPAAVRSAEYAVEAATLADSFSAQVAPDWHHSNGTHQESIEAGILYDSWSLTQEPRSTEATPFTRGKIWDFALDVDVWTTIADLQKRFPLQPHPLILPRKRGVSEAVQHRVETAAVHLMGTPEAAKWWFTTPNNDLAGKKPIEFLTEKSVGFLEEYIRSSDGGGYG